MRGTDVSDMTAEQAIEAISASLGDVYLPVLKELSEAAQAPEATAAGGMVAAAYAEGAHDMAIQLLVGLGLGRVLAPSDKDALRSHFVKGLDHFVRFYLWQRS